MTDYDDEHRQLPIMQVIIGFAFISALWLIAFAFCAAIIWML